MNETASEFAGPTPPRADRPRWVPAEAGRRAADARLRRLPVPCPPRDDSQGQKAAPHEEDRRRLRNCRNGGDRIVVDVPGVVASGPERVEETVGKRGDDRSGAAGIRSAEGNVRSRQAAVKAERIGLAAKVEDEIDVVPHVAREGTDHGEAWTDEGNAVAGANADAAEEADERGTDSGELPASLERARVQPEVGGKGDEGTGGE